MTKMKTETIVLRGNGNWYDIDDIDDQEYIDKVVVVECSEEFYNIASDQSGGDGYKTNRGNYYVRARGKFASAAAASMEGALK